MSHVLPPIPTIIQPTLKVNFKGRSGPKTGSDDDGGFKASTTNLKDPTLVSLHVCRECQDRLLSCFQHCLSKDELGSSKSALSSVLEVEEAKDSISRFPPPYFKLINNPAPIQVAMYESIAHKAEKDRIVFKEGRQSRWGGKRETAIALNYWNMSTSQTSLDDQHDSIIELRKRLSAKKYSEKMKYRQVEELQHMFRKSVEYYSHAEEWQHYETSRLRLHIHYLKAELCSLTGFVVSSEHARSQVNISLETFGDLILDRNSRIRELQHTYDNIKETLHQSFKDFLMTNEALIELRQDARRGSELVQSRNQILQRNLDKLAKDFEASSKELAVAQSKIKELEYTLDNLMQKFNSTADSKKNTEQDNVKLKTENSKSRNDLKLMEAEHARYASRAEILQLDIQELVKKHSLRKVELENKILELGSQVEMVKATKTDMEATLKQYKAENEKLTMALKALNRAKEQLDSTFRITSRKAEKELAQRDERIAEMEITRDRDQQKLELLTKQKEKIFMQIEELEAQLDIQVTNVSTVQVELLQMKKSLENSAATLQQDIDKSVFSKSNLVGDKKQLNEKLRLVQNELSVKKKLRSSLEASYLRQLKDGNTFIQELSEKMRHLELKQSTLTFEHEQLLGDHHNFIDSNASLKVQLNSAEKALQLLKDEESSVDSQLRGLRASTQTSKNTHYEYSLERDVVNQQIKGSLSRVADLTTETNEAERERETLFDTMDAGILRKTTTLYDHREVVEELKQAVVSLEIHRNRLTEELRFNRTLLSAQTAERESIENGIFDARQMVVSEHIMRKEFERMHTKLSLFDDMRRVQTRGVDQARKRLLRQGEQTFCQYHQRLTDYSQIIFPEKGS
ncbi:hypothetical protein BJ742DRAFT_393878 [Cladochytrium replicatum]|nr:hypothetical protein BJ742DRAFT_393878 [Cladochytrium replicatum]